MTDVYLDCQSDFITCFASLRSLAGLVEEIQPLERPVESLWESCVMQNVSDCDSELPVCGLLPERAAE